MIAAAPSVFTVDPAVAVAGLATAMTAVTAWPQIRKLRRTGDAAGVSLAGATLSMASESGWVVYTSGQRLWSALPEAVLSLTVSAALAATLVHAGAPWARSASVACGWLALLLAAWLLIGPTALGACLSLAYGLQLAPSVWTAWRTRRPTGLAASTWLLRAAQSFLWGTYGLLSGDRPLLTLGVLGVTGSAAILVRVVVTADRPAPVMPVTVG